MIRVLMIMTTPFTKTGIGSVVKNYTSVLHNRVHFDFLLCCGIGDEEKKYVNSINGEIIIPIANRERHPFQYVKEVIGLLRKRNYDVSHVHGNSSTMFFDVLASRIAGIKKVIAHTHSTYTDYPFLHKMLKPFFNLLITRGLACSDDAGKFCFYNYSILNNAIETKRFCYSSECRNSLRARYNLSDDEFVLLNVGHLDKGKNQKYLIDLVSKLKTKHGICLKLFLVGQGNMKNALNEQIVNEALEENVYLIEESSVIEQFYSMSDLFVLPSLYEGLGIVLIEAQASGLHCIASQGVPELSNLCGTVKYISLNDEEGWIKAIIEEYNHFIDRVEKSDQCCTIIKQKGYDITVAADDLMALYL